jgi:hypothetical protein
MVPACKLQPNPSSPVGARARPSLHHRDWQYKYCRINNLDEYIAEMSPGAATNVHELRD